MNSLVLDTGVWHGHVGSRWVLLHGPIDCLFQGEGHGKTPGQTRAPSLPSSRAGTAVNVPGGERGKLGNKAEKRMGLNEDDIERQAAETGLAPMGNGEP